MIAYASIAIIRPGIFFGYDFVFPTFLHNILTFYGKCNEDGAIHRLHCSATQITDAMLGRKESGRAGTKLNIGAKHIVWSGLRGRQRPGVLFSVIMDSVPALLTGWLAGS